MTLVFRWEETHAYFRDICSGKIDGPVWSECNKQIWGPAFYPLMFNVIQNIRRELRK